MTWDIVVKLGGLIGLLLGIYNFYLQRQDKKPRLTVSIARDYVDVPRTDSVGGTVMIGKPGFKIHARNPTDKTIKVEEIYFWDGKRHCVVPRQWGTIDEIPSHEKRSMGGSLPTFHEWVKVMKITNPEKGYFVLEDALERRYKTTKLGDLIELQPIEDIVRLTLS